MRAPRSLSVIVPAYNESARLPEALRRMGTYFEAQRYASELIIVDDGSGDGTAEIAREVASELNLPVRVLRYSSNGGKGFALKVGFAHARGERILFTDADLATPIEETAGLLKALDEGAELAIGSRRTEGSSILVHQPWYRERMGKSFTWLVQTFLADVSDVTCGFKAFRADCGRKLFSHLRIHDWSYDAELLFLAAKFGSRLEEVPVRWADQDGTRVRLLRDAIGSLLGLVRIRVNAARGVYRTPAPLTVGVESWTNPAGSRPMGASNAPEASV